MFIRNLASAIAGLTFLLSAVPVQAQTYRYNAPSPRLISESENSPERLAFDSQAVVYASWGFNYARTADNNLFVTRIFVSDFGRDTAGANVQIDCGRGLFRHVTSPQFYANRETPGTPIDVAVNQWLILDRRSSFGQAMMRSCESAASEAGITWQWF